MPNYMNFLSTSVQSNNQYPVAISLKIEQPKTAYKISYQSQSKANQKTSEQRSYDYYLKRLEQDFDAQKLGFLDEDDFLADSSYYDDEMEHRPFDLPKTLYNLGKSFDPKLADIICDGE